MLDSGRLALPPGHLEIPGTIHHPSFYAGFMIRPGKQNRLKRSFSNVPIDPYTLPPASGRVVVPPSFVLSLPFLLIVLVPVSCCLIVPQWVDRLLQGRTSTVILFYSFFNSV